MIEPLDAINAQMWNDGLNDSAFNALREKASMLSAQIGVHLLSLAPQNPSGLPGALSAVGKVIEVVVKYLNIDNYGKFDKFEAG
jgi:type IV secretory pathway TrbL component